MVMNNFSQVLEVLYVAGVSVGVIFSTLGVLEGSDGYFAAARAAVAIPIGMEAVGEFSDLSTGGRVVFVTENTSSQGTGHRIFAVDGFGTSSEKEITDPDANLPSVGDEVVFTPDGWKQQ